MPPAPVTTAELRVRIARYKSMQEFTDRLVATRDLDTIAKLAITHAKYLADVVHFQLVGALDEDKGWRDATAVFVISGTPTEVRCKEHRFRDLDDEVRAVLIEDRVRWWNRSATKDDEVLSKIAADLDCPAVLALPFRQSIGLRGGLILAARTLPTDLDQSFLRSLALLTGNTAVSVIRERNLVRALEQRNAEMHGLIEDLSAVISPVWDGVLVTPLLGRLDRERTQRIMERLLTAAHDSGARQVILDLTGISAIDPDTIDHLTRILQGLTLIGARGIVVGVQPTIARILGEIGYTGDAIIFRRNLKEAVAECILRNSAS